MIPPFNLGMRTTDKYVPPLGMYIVKTGQSMFGDYAWTLRGGWSRIPDFWIGRPLEYFHSVARPEGAEIDQEG